MKTGLYILVGLAFLALAGYACSTVGTPSAVSTPIAVAPPVKPPVVTTPPHVAATWKPTTSITEVLKTIVVKPNDPPGTRERLLHSEATTALAFAKAGDVVGGNLALFNAGAVKTREDEIAYRRYWGLDELRTTPGGN